jgi:hypothetical protein
MMNRFQLRFNFAFNFSLRRYNQVAACDLTAVDVWLHAAPMFHAFDAQYMYALVLCGGTQVMLQGGVFTGADAAHAIAARGRATGPSPRHRCPVHHYSILLRLILPPRYVTQRMNINHFLRRSLLRCNSTNINISHLSRTSVLNSFSSRSD